MHGFLIRKGEKCNNFTKVFLEVTELHTEYNWRYKEAQTAKPSLPRAAVCRIWQRSKAA